MENYWLIVNVCVQNIENIVFRVWGMILFENELYDLQKPLNLIWH